jgi:hypothetical protein
VRRAVAAAVLLAALAAPARAAAVPAAERGRATCARQSGANFPGAYTSSRNLRVGPLVLIGGRTYTSPATVRKFGGQKYPLLLAAGHTARIEISRSARRASSLTWAGTGHGVRRVADGYRVVDARACDRRNAQSRAGSRRVTFWSGFILTSVPRCLRVAIRIDGAPTARRVRVPLGRRCR